MRFRSPCSSTCSTCLAGNQACSGPPPTRAWWCALAVTLVRACGDLVVPTPESFPLTLTACACPATPTKPCAQVRGRRGERGEARGQVQGRKRGRARRRERQRRKAAVRHGERDGVWQRLPGREQQQQRPERKQQRARSTRRRRAQAERLQRADPPDARGGRGPAVGAGAREAARVNCQARRRSGEARRRSGGRRSGVFPPPRAVRRPRPRPAVPRRGPESQAAQRRL